MSEEGSGGFLGKTRAKMGERKEAKAEAAADAAEAARARRAELLAAGELYEYTVVAVRETLRGDKIDTASLQNTINSYANAGWRLRAITSASVEGRVGAGGVTGLILTFERKARS